MAPGAECAKRVQRAVALSLPTQYPFGGNDNDNDNDNNDDNNKTNVYIYIHIYIYTNNKNNSQRNSRSRRLHISGLVLPRLVYGRRGQVVKVVLRVVLGPRAL